MQDSGDTNILAAPGNDDSFGSAWTTAGFQHWVGIHPPRSAVMRPERTSRCIREFYVKFTLENLF